MENLWRVQDTIIDDVANDDLMLALMGMPFMSCAEQLADTGDACGDEGNRDEHHNFAFGTVELDPTRPELSLIRSACPERKIPAHCSRRHQLF